MAQNSTPLEAVGGDVRPAKCGWHTVNILESMFGPLSEYLKRAEETKKVFFCFSCAVTFSSPPPNSIIYLFEEFTSHIDHAKANA